MPRRSNTLAAFFCQQGLGNAAAQRALEHYQAALRRVNDLTPGQSDLYARRAPERTPSLQQLNNIRKNAELYARERAYKVIQTIEATGRPPQGDRGGGVYLNRGGQLPTHTPNGTRINYREFDVFPNVPGTNRDAPRIVQGSDSNFHYTGIAIGHSNMSLHCDELREVDEIIRFLETFPERKKILWSESKIPVSFRLRLRSSKAIIFEEMDASTMKSFSSLAKAFSNRFGLDEESCHNWDALHDCMRDIDLYRTDYCIIWINNADLLIKNEVYGIEDAVAVFGSASEEWGAPVENGDDWDRPAKHLVFILQGSRSISRFTNGKIGFAAQ